MEITIKIDAPGLEEAVLTLAQALRGYEAPQNIKDGLDSPIKEVSKVMEKLNELPKHTPALKKEEEPTKTTEKPTEEPKKETAPTGLTFEQVRVKLAEVSQAGKQKELKELITSFGAARLSDIPEEKFAELLEKASDL